MYDLEIKLLGGIAAATPSGPLSFRSDKVRGLLAYLAAHPNQAITRDTLVRLFFPDQESSRGRKNLNLLLTRLRQSLSPLMAHHSLLQTDYHTVQLNWDETRFWADTIQIETWYHICTHHPHERIDTCQDCFYRLHQIVKLYQGDFLAGFNLGDSTAFEEWQFWQQEHFLNISLTALTLLTENALASGQAVIAEQFARRHIQLSPWQEYPHRQVMQALAQQGKSAAALQQFELCRKILAEQLGASPSAETWAYYQKLLNRSPQVSPPFLPQPIPSPGPFDHPQTPPMVLPQPGTPFFGRIEMLKELRQSILNPTHRLITLTGAGGMGKTRLAIALAHQLQDQFTHGVSFVPLAPVADVDEMVLVQVIAAAVGYVFSNLNDPLTELLNSIQTQHHLLILDNFEHLLEHTTLIRYLLEAAPHLTILVTSRHPLNIPEETIHAIKGLQLPRSDGDAAADSVQLFTERANRTGSSFKLDNTTLPHITHICRFLQGWPLALELAASWTTELSVSEIEQTLIQQLERLHTPYRDIGDRHKSMAAVLGWSYALLTPEAQQLLARLSIFQGGWTEEAAQMIVGATPAVLHHLYQHVFIEKQPNGRSTIHELIRQFAEAHVTSSENDAEAHSYYYLDWLKAQTPGLFGPEPFIVLSQIEAELNNIRKAWHWAIQNSCVTELDDVLEALGRYYTIKGMATTALFDLGAAAEQMEREAAQHVAKTPACYRLAGRLWAKQAAFHLRLGEIDKADAAATHAWNLSKQTQHHAVMSQVLAVQGGILHVRGFSYDARNTLLMGVKLARESGRPYLIADCLRRLVRPLVTDNTYLEEALQLAHDLNDSWLKNEVTQSAAGVAFYEGRLWQAYTYWQESLAYSRPFANRLATARLENNLGDLARRFGDYTQAFTYQNSALQTFRELGDSIMEAHVLEGLSRLYWQTGQTDVTWEMLQQAEQICRQHNMVSCLGYLDCTKGRMFAAAGNIRRAKAAYREAIACSSASNHPQLAMEAYAGLAELNYEKGDLDTALSWCESIMDFLAQGHVLEGFTETSWIYLTCIRVLDVHGNKRAALILERAKTEIQTLAAQITQETTRQLFLQSSSNQAVLTYQLTRNESHLLNNQSVPRRLPEMAALIKNSALSLAFSPKN